MGTKIIAETEIDLDDHPELKKFYEKFDASCQEYIISADISTGKDMSTSVAFVQNEFGEWVFDSVTYF